MLTLTLCNPLFLLLSLLISQFKHNINVTSEEICKYKRIGLSSKGFCRLSKWFQIEFLSMQKLSSVKDILL